MRKFKSIMMMVLVAIIAFSSFGCKPVEQEYIPVEPGELPNGMDVVAPTEELPRYENTVTITVLGTEYPREANVGSTYNGSESGAKNQSFNDVALEKLNIKLNYIAAPTPVQYETHLNLMINTGTIPDIFATSNPVIYELVRERGFVTDLKDQFYNLNADLQTMYLQDYYSTLQACMREGSLFAFPSPSNPYEFAKRVYLRRDWLEISGKSLPTTAEELFEVAKAFRDNASAIAAKANRVNASDIVPIGIHKELAYVDNYGPTGLFELFGAQVGAYLMNDDGELYSSNTSEEMKTAVSVISNLYSEGLISREFYSASSTSVANDVIAGKIGIVFGDWWVPDYPLGNSVNNSNTPEADWVSVELVGYGGKTALPIVKPITISNYNVVSKTCQYPEALPRLINLFYDMYYNDNAAEIYGSKATPEGGFFHNWVPVKVWNTSASVIEHKRVMRVFDELYEAGYRANLTNGIGQSDIEYVSNHATYGPILNQLKAREKTLHFLKGYPYFQSKQNGLAVKDMTPVAKLGFGIFEEMVAYDGGYAYVVALAEGTKEAKYNYFYGTATATMQSKGEYITSFLVKTFSEIIVGTKSMSSWDSFVNDYNKNGGTQILKEINQWYQAQPKASE